MTNEPNTRAAVLRLLATGAATLSEAADLAGISRQLARYWAGRAGLDAAAKRRAFLVTAWNRARAAKK